MSAARELLRRAEDELQRWGEQDAEMQHVGPADARDILAEAGADLIGVDWDEVDGLVRAMRRRDWHPRDGLVVLAAERQQLLEGREALLAVIELGEPVALTICELDP